MCPSQMHESANTNIKFFHAVKKYHESIFKNYRRIGLKNRILDASYRYIFPLRMNDPSECGYLFSEYFRESTSGSFLVRASFRNDISNFFHRPFMLQFAKNC